MLVNNTSTSTQSLPRKYTVDNYIVLLMVSDVFSLN